MKRALLILPAILLFGCISPTVKKPAHGLKVDVTAIAAAGAQLAPPLRFALLAQSSDEPLVDERLRDLFAVRMKFKGYRQDDASPDLLISCSHAVTPSEETIPERHEKEKFYEDPKTEYVTRIVHGSPMTVVKTSNGRWRSRDKIVPAKVKQVFFKKINVLIYSAAAAPATSPTALPLWEGHVSSTHENADLLKFAPVMLRELSDELPSPSGKGESRFTQP